MTHEKYVGTKQAASLAGVTERTIRRWVAQRRLVAYRTHPSKRGGRLRFRLSDVERLLRGELPAMDA